MLIERGTSYGVRVTVRGRQKWVGSFPFAEYGGKRKARAAAEEAERNAKVAGARYRSADETCDSFARRWPDDYPREALATQRNQRYATKRFIQDFEGVRLDELDRPTARAWAVGQPRKNVEILRAMFSDAVNDGLCTENPFANLRLPQSRGRKDLVVITEEDVRALAAKAIAIHGPAYGPTIAGMIMFAAGTGVRPAELWALERDDVDQVACEATIRQTVKADGRIRPLTKNYRRRTIVLTPLAIEGLELVTPRVDAPHVFTTPRGRHFTRSQHDRYWSAVRKAWAAELPAAHPFRRRFDTDPEDNLDFYELRHYCATELLERGASHADVSLQLGHQDGGKLVMSTYGHPNELAARGRIKALYGANVTPIRVASGEQEAQNA